MLEKSKNFTYEKLTPMLKHYVDVKDSFRDSLLLYRVGDFYESFFDDAKNKDSLISSNSESFKYIRLKRRLSRLFDMNGQNTDVLDVLLNSQAVFDGFEKRKMRSEKNIEEVSQEYRQMPNDFMLEEYVLELSQLKVSLNIERFADVYANEILGKIE